MSDTNTISPQVNDRPLQKISKHGGQAAQVPKPYLDVAKGMESQFARYMFEQMRKTVPESEQSTAQDFYNSMLDDERARLLAQRNEGKGLQRLILEQIYPQIKTMSAPGTVSSAVQKYMKASSTYNNSVKAPIQNEVSND